ncbi:MAG TPA: WYL domain-containing protein [Candidatus Olsenella pullistercoris]|uniref:WYL domain-containing protein n=1 Tax=Candidatus Olsenella pullistercoris TaxID=2838712 RepID=A0A9D2EXZ4_9ACTN|nr:WYL domain-containing protein [Candidatus Olsenella pullistercoris]
MSRDELTPEDMEGMLSESACSTRTGKSRTLAVMDILRAFTDGDHGLTAREIASVIGARTGREPSEGAVLSDLHEIAANRPLGMEVIIPARGESGGFRSKRSALTVAQARLLVNMVRTCKFVTAAQRSELCEAVYETVSIAQQDMIAGVCTDDREAPRSSDAFEAADVSLRAMEMGRMLRFSYVDWGLDGVERPLASPDGTTAFEETPISLVYSFGNYYLETWADFPAPGRRMARRLDRMRHPEVSPRRARNTKEVRDLGRTVRERTEQTFDMWGDGIPRTLFLRIDSSAARYAFDRFGHGLRIRHVAEDGSHGYACVTVQLAPTFYRWVVGMGGGITIARPQGPGWLVPFWEDATIAEKSLEELEEDYRAAISGLEKLMSACAKAHGIEREEGMR